MCFWGKVYRSAVIPQNFTCPEKFLVARLPRVVNCISKEKVSYELIVLGISEEKVSYEIIVLGIIISVSFHWEVSWTAFSLLVLTVVSSLTTLFLHFTFIINYPDYSVLQTVL